MFSCKKNPSCTRPQGKAKHFITVGQQVAGCLLNVLLANHQLASEVVYLQAELQAPAK